MNIQEIRMKFGISIWIMLIVIWFLLIVILAKVDRLEMKLQQYDNALHLETTEIIARNK